MNGASHAPAPASSLAAAPVTGELSFLLRMTPGVPLTDQISYTVVMGIAKEVLAAQKAGMSEVFMRCTLGPAPSAASSIPVVDVEEESEDDLPEYPQSYSIMSKPPLRSPPPPAPARTISFQGNPCVLCRTILPPGYAVFCDRCNVHAELPAPPVPPCLCCKAPMQHASISKLCMACESGVLAPWR